MTRTSSKLVTYLLVGFAGLSVSCQLSLPDPSPTTLVVSGGVKAAELAEAVKTDTPAAVARDDAAQAKRLSVVAASVNAMPLAKPAIADGPGKDAVFTEQEIAADSLKDVVVSAADNAAAIRRITSRLEGRIAEADTAKLAALSESAKLKIERDAAHKEKQDAIDGQRRLADEATKEREQLKVQYDARLSSLATSVTLARTERDSALDVVKKENLAQLGQIILALSGLCFLVAVGLLVASSGKEFVRAGLAFLCALIGFTCYWTMNQSWFKYLVMGSSGLVLVLVGVLVWYERRERLKQVAVTQELHDYDKVWATGKSFVSGLDAWAAETSPEIAKPLLDKLSAYMDAEHKNIIHELRFEAKKAK